MNETFASLVGLGILGVGLVLYAVMQRLIFSRVPLD
jgi:hypothetical protein